MAHVTTAQVQAWLESTKLSVTSLDAELEDSITVTVLGSVSKQYDTSTWLTVASTPKLVQKIIAIMYAAAFYRRAYSEQDTGTINTYADQLDKMADNLLSGVLAGSILLTDVAATAADESPDYYPQDSTGNGNMQSDSAPGRLYPDGSNGLVGWHDQAYEGAKFTMGQVF